MDLEDVLTIKSDEDKPQIDPDPFGIAFALLSLIFAGGCYLETRRNRQYLERQAKEDFRKIWFRAKRTLIHAKRITEEFATHVQEEAFGEANFVFGTIKLTIDQDKAQQLRRIHGNAQTTAMHMADDLDDLSNYLSTDYKEQIDAIQNKLKEQTLPHSYDAVLILARDAIELYDNLINEVGKKEEFC
jgi:hypothetical protein